MRTRLRFPAARAAVCILVCIGCVWLLPAMTHENTALAQSASVVKAYSCPPGSAQALADQIRLEFGVIPNVRIAADERTSQVIAYAPPEVQTQISKRLAVLASTANPNNPASGPALPHQVRPQSRVHALQCCTAAQLEQALANLLGNRFVALPAPRAQAKDYQITGRNGENTTLTIDFAANQATLDGPAASVEASARLVEALDSRDVAGGRQTRLVPLRTSKPASIHNAIAAIRDGTAVTQTHMPLAAALFQSKESNSDQNKPSPKADASIQKSPPRKPGVGLVNPVEIESLEGLDTLILRGKAQDVEQVLEIINQIERVSAETEPAIEVFVLRQADCQTLTPMLQSLYEEVYLPRQGDVSITAVVKPNALLIVGRPENVRTVIDLAERLDLPVAPDTQFRVFQLRYAAAATVQATIDDFYKDRKGLGPQVRVTADIRSNALLVQAAPRGMDELAAMIARIDTPKAAAVNEVRIIQLEHSLAKDLAEVLQQAIGAAVANTQASTPAAPRAGQRPAAAQAGRPQVEQRSAMLRFLTIDARGRRLVESGILTNVQVTADVRANAIVVSAPAECMELIETLIHRLDALPAAEAQVKVFTIVNSDATALADMLNKLFAAQAAGGPAATPAGTQDSLVSLRFAVDARTNSIIATGSAAELTVVEAIIMRLDDSGVRHRQSVVFRLKNSPAEAVAGAVNEFLRTERQVQQQSPGMTSAFEQIEREVVVVPETVSNSLILSATPRFFEEVKGLIEQLDARPPMVMIQVLIADITLGNTDEFGIEMGLQDGLLFDRSLLSGIETISTSVVNPNQTTTQTQTIVAANNSPGFNFNNNQPLGNSGAANSLANASLIGGQGISNFGVGRAGQAGFGGLVLSASSESVSILLRALSECHRLEVLQRPQIMTLDNQPAFIQVGQRVPRIQSAQFTQVAQINTTIMENVGLVLGVTPRISPDGLVVMEIDAEKSDVGTDAEGTPITVAEGQVIRSPRINITLAQTTVSATSGQTVVLGGLISKNKLEYHRKVPWLGDLPLVGRLFRFDSTSSERKELLIIMTPHIVRSEADAETIKQAEAARMSWCLGDVVALHGDAGLRCRTDEWSDAETQAVYPDMKPVLGADGKPIGPEMIPVPEGMPVEKSK